MINGTVNLIEQLLKNKEKEILKNLLTNVLNFEIKDIQYEKNIQLNDISEYEFELVKAIITLNTDEQIEMYLRMVKNSKIKESIFCYWCSIYEEELVKAKELENADIFINKVAISELEHEQYKKRIFLTIENNKTSILETGTEVNFIEITEYIKQNQNEKNQYKNLEKYFENQNNEVLLIGIKMEKRS